MGELSDMIWAEALKAWRSRVPLFTAAAALLLPLGIGFLIWVATHPDVSDRLGLIGAKANLLPYAQTGWTGYLVFLAQAVAAGGFFLASFVVSWVFGREFVDGTLKDLLAVPVRRANILLGKFIVVAGWSAALAAEMIAAGVVLGALMGLPQDGARDMVRAGVAVLATAAMTIGVALPLALPASAGRGYLVPLGLAVVLLVLANLLAVLGLAQYYPWGVPAIYAQGKLALPMASYALVVVTAVAGMAATYAWWQRADQSR